MEGRQGRQGRGWKVRGGEGEPGPGSSKVRAEGRGNPGRREQGGGGGRLTEAAPLRFAASTRRSWVRTQGLTPAFGNTPPRTPASVWAPASQTRAPIRLSPSREGGGGHPHRRRRRRHPTHRRTSAVAVDTTATAQSTVAWGLGGEADG